MGHYFYFSSGETQIRALEDQSPPGMCKLVSRTVCPRSHDPFYTVSSVNYKTNVYKSEASDYQNKQTKTSGRLTGN